MYLTVKNPDTQEQTEMHVLENKGFYYAFKTEYDRVARTLKVEPDKHFLLLAIAPNQPAHTVRIFSQKTFIGNIYNQGLER